jgi:hypothetical protein
MKTLKEVNSSLEILTTEEWKALPDEDKKTYRRIALGEYLSKKIGSIDLPAIPGTKNRKSFF